MVVKSALQKGKLASNWSQEILCREEKQDGAEGGEGQRKGIYKLGGWGGWLLVLKSALQTNY